MAIRFICDLCGCDTPGRPVRNYGGGAQVVSAIILDHADVRLRIFATRLPKAEHTDGPDNADLCTNCIKKVLDEGTGVAE